MKTHRRRISSILMRVLQLGFLKTSFRPISKNWRNVQISVKTQKIISQKCSLPKPLGHSEDFGSSVFEALMMLLSEHKMAIFTFRMEFLSFGQEQARAVF